MSKRSAYLKFTGVASLLLAGMWLTAQAADEVCGTCSPQVTVNGDFTHGRDAAGGRGGRGPGGGPGAPGGAAPGGAGAPAGGPGGAGGRGGRGAAPAPIEGVGDNAAAYREDINGKNFTVVVAGLPAGKYTIDVSAAETQATAAGQRVFTVTADEATIAKDFDIFAVAGARKVATVSGSVDHGDDALRGPLKITFTAKADSQNPAKFNRINIKKADGTTALAFGANELADAFTAGSVKVPDIKEAPIWRDASKPMDARIDDLIRRMSLAEKVAQLKNAAPAIERLGLPSYDYWNEALHGVANNGIATVFPESIGGAATWNPSLLHAEGNVIGIEGRAKHNDYVNSNNGNSKWWAGLTFWTPNINIFRDPRWGRGQETFGEDPHLTSEIGIEFVKGIQGDDPNYMLAMACAKHYAVHSGPEADRHRMDVKVDQRDLYETYLPQFERVVREGKVAGVMTAYNSVDGQPASANTLLVTDLLRGKWGFQGYVVSDCDAIGDVWRNHHFVGSAEEAAAVSIKTGTDLCCGSDYNALVRAVQANLVGEKEINRALHYTLWTRFKMGLFDPADKVTYSKITIKDNDTPEHRKVALDVARESLVLLKNDGILPLDKSKYKKIAVIGPNADSKSMLLGNYHGSASKPVSIFAGIKETAGPNVEVNYSLGTIITSITRTAPYSGQDSNSNKPAADLNAEAIKLAGESDLVIYVGGITAGQEGESYDRTAIEIPEIQEKFIHDLQAVGKPMVMVNCSGSAVALTWEDEHLPAIMQAWYPGGDGGRAVAEALFGEINPSGHLPVMFYRATSDLPGFTDYSMANRTYRYFNGKPLYAFGHGLSYTTFDFANGKLSSNKVGPSDTVKVSFTVKNTGKLAGDEVAQVYYRHVNSKVPQAKQALCVFSRVTVNNGASTEVTINVPVERMRYWDVEKKQYVVEAGEYEMLVGSASDEIKLKLPLTVTQ